MNSKPGWQWTAISNILVSYSTMNSEPEWQKTAIYVHILVSNTIMNFDPCWQRNTISNICVSYTGMDSICNIEYHIQI